MLKFNDKQYEAYKEIFRLCPSVFVIRGEHYYIGSCVFRKCSEEEIANYNEFCACLADIKADSITEPRKSKLNRLKEIFGKVMFREDFKYNDEEYEKANQKLQEFIINITDEEAQDILEQKNDILIADNCYNDAFYRNEKYII